MKHYECKKCGQKVMAGAMPKCACPCCNETGLFIRIILPENSYFIIGQIDGREIKR